MKLWLNNRVRFIWIILILAEGITSFSQGFRSVNYPNGSQTCVSRFVEESTVGNYISIGLFYDSNGINSLCVNGIDNTGNITWEKKYGDNLFYYLQADGLSREAIKYQNNFYFAGCVRQGTAQNGALVKIDFNGDTVWQKVYKETNWTTGIRMLAPSVDGGFLLTGFSEGTGTQGRPCLLMKTDSKGDLLWKTKFNKASRNVIIGNCVLQDPITKKIIIGGYCYGVTPDSLFPYVIVADSIGNLLEQKRIGSEQGFLSDITRLADGSFILVGGTTTNTLDVSNSMNLMFSLHVKLDNTFVPVSIKNYDRASPSNYFTTVNVVNNGTEYVTAGSLDTCAQYFPPFVYNELLRLSKFDDSGNLLNSRTYAYSQFVDPNKPYFANYLRCNHLAMTSDGGMVAALQFNNYTMRIPFFNIKFDASGCDSTVAYCLNPTGIKEQNTLKYAVFPNPASTEITIHKESTFFHETTALLTDLVGREIVSCPLSGNHTVIDVQNITPGVYYLRLSENGSTVKTVKIAIIR